LTDTFDPAERAIRGRRDPALALELEGHQLADPGDEETGNFGLAAGDQILFKIVRGVPSPIDGTDRWFTFGANTSVMDGEDGEQAADRIYTFVATAFEQIITAQDAALREQHEERRNRPIQPRTNAATR
jgi:hypothetical protein